MRWLVKVAPLLLIVSVWMLSEQFFPIISAAGLTVTPSQNPVTPGSTTTVTIGYNEVYTTTISLTVTAGSISPSSMVVAPASAGSFTATFTAPITPTTVQITATDTFGNSAFGFITILSPTTLAISPTSITIPAGGTTLLTVTYNILCECSSDTITLTATSGSISPSSTTVPRAAGSFTATFTDTANSAPGTTITVTATDAHGISSAPATITIANVGKLVLNPPSTTIASGGTAALTVLYSSGKSETISLSTTSGSVNPSSQLVNPPSGSFPVTFTDTANSAPGTTITVTATDAYGNTQTSTITIATSPPPPPPPTQVTIGGRVHLDGIGFGGVLCTLDNGPQTRSALDGTYSFGGIRPGTHSVYCNPPQGAQPASPDPVTVTASPGATLSSVNFFFVTQGLPGAKHIIVTADPTTVRVGKTSTITIIYPGGGGVKIKATLGTLSQSRFTGNGQPQTFTAIYTAGQVPGTATITASDITDPALPGSVTLTIVSAKPTPVPHPPKPPGNPPGTGTSHCRGLTLRLSNGQTVTIVIAPNSVLPDTCIIDVIVNGITPPTFIPNGGSIIETVVIIAKTPNGQVIHVPPGLVTMTITASPLPVTLVSVAPANQGFGGLASLFSPSIAEAAGPELVIAASTVTVYQQTSAAKSATTFVTVPSTVNTAKQSVTFTTSNPFNGPFIISGTAVASGTSSGQNAPAPAQSAPAQGGGQATGSPTEAVPSTLPLTGREWNPLGAIALLLLMFVAGLFIKRLTRRQSKPA